MASEKQAAKQRTRPRGKKADGTPAEPIEIPVPKRSTFEKLVKRASRPEKKP